jgi:hypothetical protein
VVDGIVENLNVHLGDFVKKGQTLAVIRSSNIAEFQSQVVYSRSNVQTAEKNLQVAREMLAGGLATEKDVVSAENDLIKADADLKKSTQITQIYGAGGNAIQAMKAPISGFVVEKNATDKMQYQANNTQPFFIISKTRASSFPKRSSECCLCLSTAAPTPAPAGAMGSDCRLFCRLPIWIMQPLPITGKPNSTCLFFLLRRYGCLPGKPCKEEK